ncbi:hypothetical protein BV898_10869 [Hypsibius exemplaris]|uniref:DOPA 4,5-dioxygenase n=1 Tax=Hypsibius exemplaris TaxID=2072580 RepID=A0A1W0WIC5_HYPEX|nr:hypothetical protein BV898_10869 [Hypsibius exemplaris]
MFLKILTLLIICDQSPAYSDRKTCSESTTSSCDMSGDAQSAERPRWFHGHVYFDSKSQAFAGQLQEKTKAAFKGQPVRTGQLIPYPIGPHPTGMFEIDFSKAFFTDVVLWLERERGDLSVLVHELTGDEMYDHTQAALWLGPQQPLKFSVLKGGRYEL